MADLNLKESIYSDIEIIEKDINSIEKMLMQVYNAMKTLDEEKWKAKEKEKIDQEFMPYLEKVSTKYPVELKRNLNYLKIAVQAYEKHDEVATSKIEEVSSGITFNTNEKDSIEILEDL